MKIKWIAYCLGGWVCIPFPSSEYSAATVDKGIINSKWFTSLQKFIEQFLSIRVVSLFFLLAQRRAIIIKVFRDFIARPRSIASFQLLLPIESGKLAKNNFGKKRIDTNLKKERHITGINKFSLLAFLFSGGNQWFSPQPLSSAIAHFIVILWRYCHHNRTLTTTSSWKTSVLCEFCIINYLSSQQRKFNQSRVRRKNRKVVK